MSAIVSSAPAAASLEPASPSRDCVISGATPPCLEIYSALISFAARTQSARAAISLAGVGEGVVASLAIAISGSMPPAF